MRITKHIFQWTKIHTCHSSSHLRSIAIRENMCRGIFERNTGSSSPCAPCTKSGSRKNESHGLPSMRRYRPARTVLQNIGKGILNQCGHFSLRRKSSPPHICDMSPSSRGACGDMRMKRGHTPPVRHPALDAGSHAPNSAVMELGFASIKILIS